MRRSAFAVWRLGPTAVALACAAALSCGTVHDGAPATAARDPGRAPDSSADTPDAIRSGPVLPGIDVLLRDSLELVRGKRVGLITNQTGLSTIRSAPDHDSRETSTTVEILHGRSDLQLVALFSPEHGLGGDAPPGDKIPSGREPRTGLPIYSLYGATNRPQPWMLDGVDVLLFDIQDVGARYYTYVWTMALAMQVAGSAGIPFVVLDRPDPIGGTLVQGDVLDPKLSSFIGLYPVPMRHGMTVGEMARLLVGEFGVKVDLHVVPAAGWSRAQWFDETALPWVPPSPNMPTLESAAHYPGTCLFEGTNLSVGRGTEHPFEWIGAPWLDGVALADRLNGYRLPGVRFEPATFTPSRPGDAKWPDTVVHGVRFVMTDRTSYDPTRAAVAALIEAKQLAGSSWKWVTPHFDQLAGTETLRAQIDAGRTLDEIVGPWDAQLAAFRTLRGRYLIYR